MSGIKGFLKKIPGLRPAVAGMKSFVKDAATIPNFLAERKIKRSDGPIRVAFLCQFLPVWHKYEPIYRAMREDPRFEPMLICVPSDIQSRDNDILRYFVNAGYTEAVDAVLPAGGWLDLKALDLAYIFYPRPYDALMPPEYASNKVSRFSKICITLYGMNTTKDVVATTLNRAFYRNVYCFIAELPFSQKANRKLGWLCHSLKLQESVYFGMPGIEGILEGKGKASPSWDFSRNDFRAMWTPRWTSDLSMGGTNFFNFYNALPDFAQQHPDMDFLFRPHPLALQHFQKTGELTAEEADAFLARCDGLPNVSIDKEKEYLSTFWNTDVLISDISGMLPEYFVTGKPLIFCADNMVLTPEETMAKILKGSYIIHKKEELFDCLLMLKNGNDPLAETRAQIVKELYNEELCHPTQKIVEHFANK